MNDNKSFIHFLVTTSCQLSWEHVRLTTRKVPRTGHISTWMSSSRRENWPSTCISWTTTTSYTILTSSGRALASSSTRTSGAGFVQCCTTSVNQNITRTWMSGGEETEFALWRLGERKISSNQGMCVIGWFYWIVDLKLISKSEINF